MIKQKKIIVFRTYETSVHFVLKTANVFVKLLKKTAETHTHRHKRTISLD